MASPFDYQSQDPTYNALLAKVKECKAAWKAAAKAWGAPETFEAFKKADEAMMQAAKELKEYTPGSNSTPLDTLSTKVS